MTSQTPTHPAAATDPAGSHLRALAMSLSQSFGAEFDIWEAATCRRLVRSSEAPYGDELLHEALISAFGFQSEPTLLDETDHVARLAIPLLLDNQQRVIAVGTFVIGIPDDDDQDGHDDRLSRGGALQETARVLGMAPSRTREWLVRQPRWTVHSILRMAAEFQRRRDFERSTEGLQNEINKVSEHLAGTYEEVRLVYDLSEHLRLVNSERQLGELVVERLLDIIPTESAIVLLNLTHNAPSDETTGLSTSTLLTGGEGDYDAARIAELLAVIHPPGSTKPTVVNTDVTESPTWRFPEIRSAVAVSISEGDQVYGWLLAVNCTLPRGFGSVEAHLLQSLGALLGIHAGNQRLYRDQAELVSNVVRAMTSAIDAKDTYTRGHSERVAEISTCLARELGGDEGFLKSIYMAGLLHDVGKIGVDDRVLRKTGRLTDEEFEQIKTHPILGHRILAELKPLAPVLPAVLHHHEQWNGTGYPQQLKGDEIPLIARIVAVADSYDAMTSDRPYRQGMSDEVVDRIIRDGATKQWDAQIVEAYFRARDRIRQVTKRCRARMADQEPPPHS